MPLPLRIRRQVIFDENVDLLNDADDSINFHEFVNKPTEHSESFIKLCRLLLYPGYLKAVELKNSRPAPPYNDGPAENGGHMDIPPARMIRNPGAHFDQAVDWQMGDIC